MISLGLLPCYKNDNARLPECLPCKYEDLSLVPSVILSKLGIVVHACKPSVGEAGDWWMPGA